MQQDALSRANEEIAEKWLSAQDFGAPVSSNLGAGNLPFQRWFRFKEAYSPAFVTDTITTCDYPVRRILDPFGGSGHYGTGSTNARLGQLFNRGKSVFGGLDQGKGDAYVSRYILIIVPKPRRSDKNLRGGLRPN